MIYWTSKFQNWDELAIETQERKNQQGNVDCILLEPENKKKRQLYSSQISKTSELKRLGDASGLRTQEQYWPKRVLSTVWIASGVISTYLQLH
jgi:hypothetical protein